MQNQQERQRAALQMIINASDDDDDDNVDDQPVMTEKDALPEDEDMFDGWEEEEIEQIKLRGWRE